MAVLWLDGYIPDVKEVLTMFVKTGKTASRHSSSSDVGIGSSAHDLGVVTVASRQ